VVYQFLLLSNEIDDFVLEVLAHGQNTFLELHHTISSALNYDPHYLASFIRTDNDWNPLSEATLVEMDNNSLIMEDLKIEDWCKAPGQKFIYIFDYFSERGLFIKLLSIQKSELLPAELPQVLRLSGEIPVQVKRGEKHIDDLLDAFSKN